MRRWTIGVPAALAAAVLAAWTWPVALAYHFDVPQPFRYRVEYAGQGTYSRRTGPGTAPRPLEVTARARFLVEARRAPEAAARGGKTARPTYRLLLRPEGLSHSLTLDGRTDRVVLGPGILQITRGDRTVFDLATAGEQPKNGLVARAREPLELVMDHLGDGRTWSGGDALEAVVPQLAPREVLGLSLVRLPEAPVAQNGSWEASYPLDLPHCRPGACVLAMRHTAAESTRVRGFDCLRVHVSGLADLSRESFTHGGEADIVAGSDVRYDDLRQEVVGTVDFAPDEGLVVAAELSVRTLYHAVFAYVEGGSRPTQVFVAVDLAVESRFFFDGEKPARSLWERVRGLWD